MNFSDEAIVSRLCRMVVVTFSGWWFVHVQDQQGWVPSTYLKRADGGKEELGERARPGEGDWLIKINTFMKMMGFFLFLE